MTVSISSPSKLQLQEYITVTIPYKESHNISERIADSAIILKRHEQHNPVCGRLNRILHYAQWLT